jgi:hypothetical protein
VDQRLPFHLSRRLERDGVNALHAPSLPPSLPLFLPTFLPV